jgi:chromosome segregation ATPase
LTTTSFSSQISSIEKLTTKRISTLRENIYELKSTQTSQQSQLELKENMQKDIFKEIEEYKNNYLSHKKMYKKLEKKLSKSTLKITPLRNKIELYQRYISELETSLHYIKSSQKSSYLPTYQILLSLGLLYYSQKNSKSYKIQKIEEKIYAYKQKIEQLQTTILQLEQQKREIQQSIQHYAALCDDEEIERKEQELQEMYETIAHIKEKQNDVNSKREEYEFELDKVILTHQRCSHYSLSQLFQHVSNEAEFIKNQLDLYSQERANSLHNGYYYQK